MKIHRIRHKLLIVLTIALSLGFSSIAYFYTVTVEKSILNEYRRTLHSLTETVILNIETMMKENHSEIMPDFARRLRVLPGVIDFRVVRVDGVEAYVDNKTIDEVNARLGSSVYTQRPGAPQAQRVFSPDEPGVVQALRGAEAILVKSAGNSQSDTASIVDFYDAIPFRADCVRCHGAQKPAMGVLKLTTSMAQIERDMLQVRLTSLIVLVMALVLTTAGTGYMLGRFVATPIEQITSAMGRVSSGQVGVQLESGRRDELGNMARSFNKMTTNLQLSYENMKREQDKLFSVIQGTNEAVVVTDATGKVVLVNGAAEALLGKSVERISQDGLLQLVDDPTIIQAMLDLSVDNKEPTLLNYKGQWLLTSATTIRDAQGQPIGSAALLRDVTLQQALLMELERLSITDALTGVFNRRHLDARLRLEFGRARETAIPLSVALLDVDFFKKFNDTYGHDQGDRVLKMTGEVMNQTVRKYDLACRYGGEEFVVILPSTDPDGAMHFAERLRENVEAMSVDGLKVTISIGVACFPMIAVDSPQALIEAADVAMYISKRAGRNRSTLATPHMLDNAKT